MKKNGFIFMETIVVVSVLSITLLLLFTSYSFLLRKARERNVFDTTDTIYKAYNVMETIKYINSNYDNSKTANQVIADLCSNMEGTQYYVCDIKKISSQQYGSTFKSLYDTLGLEKIYLVKNEDKLFTSDFLIKFDATTIDYLRSMEKSLNDDTESPYLAVLKFKKCYEKNKTLDECEDYEVFHTSIDLEKGYANEG